MLQLCVLLFTLVFVFGIECSDIKSFKSQKHNYVSFGSSTNRPIPTEHYDHEVQLDTQGNYWMFWNLNGPNITFEVHVKTKGYVGFGLSHNGNMYPADVIVGWITDDGTPHFQDCHTSGQFAPIVDKVQNWHLLRGEENSNGTILTFTRQLDTCDDNDTVITSSTIKIIFSYHQEDPKTVAGMNWHGVQQRGTKSLRLLTSQKADVIIPDDAIQFDFTEKSFRVPRKNTRYQCSIHQIPPMNHKLHMIRYEPLIQSENEKHVHHMKMQLCPHNNKEDAGKSYDCYDKKPRHLSECKEVIASWNVGSGPYSMPEHVGFPINEDGKATTIKLEIHYHNPNLKSDIVDNSGMRLILTPTLRKHEAGGLFVGMGIHNMHFIPPYETKFTSEGICPSDCTSKALPDTGIKVYGLYQHAHLLGREIKTRHLRGHTELPPLAVDRHFDYAYQAIHVLNEEIEIKPGDAILTECKYDSTNRQNLTVGGIKLEEEMCISLLYYYPQVTMDECVSLPIYDNIDKSRNAAVKELTSWDWTDKGMRQRFQSLTNDSTHVVYCDIYSPKKYNIFHQAIPRPTRLNEKHRRGCK